MITLHLIGASKRNITSLHRLGKARLCLSRMYWQKGGGRETKCDDVVDNKAGGGNWGCTLRKHTYT